MENQMIRCILRISTFEPKLISVCSSRRLKFFPFYVGLREISYEGGWEVPATAIASANAGYGHLETFLSGSKYLVGDQLTVADFSVITSVSQLAKLVPIDTDKYPLLTQWIKRFDELSYFKDINTAWMNEMMIFVEGIRAKNKAAAQAK